MRRTSRGGNNGPSIEDNLFPVCTMATRRNYHGHDRVSDLDACRHAFAHFIDDASRVHPRHVWGWVDFLLLSP